MFDTPTMPLSKGKEADNPDGSPHIAATFVHLQHLGEAVPYPDGSVVGLVKPLVGADGSPVVRFEGFVFFYGVQVFDGHKDVVQLVAFVIDQLQGAEGNVYILSAGVSFILIYTYYLEHHAAHIEHLSQRGSSVFEEGLYRTFVDDGYFSLLLDVQFVDEAALDQLGTFYFYIVGMYAHQHFVDVFVAIADDHTVLAYYGSHAFHVVLHGLGDIDVFVVQLYSSSLLQSVVGFAGPSARYAYGIHGERRHLFVLCIHDSVAGSQQKDKDEDTPCHGKTRKGGTQFIASDGGEYFLPKVYHTLSFIS